jgi:transposase
VRGTDNRTGQLFSYVDLEARARADHPLRAIRAIVNEALAGSTRGLAVRQSPQRSFSERCCCRHSTRSGRNGS